MIYNYIFYIFNIIYYIYNIGLYSGYHYLSLIKSFNSFKSIFTLILIYLFLIKFSWLAYFNTQAAIWTETSQIFSNFG